ncbi:MAG: hypothetical protein GY854_08700 [Deltaproteobacteria bacterium]|nr:hypothetical protein [Deltaproteobacteria bacterium]
MNLEQLAILGIVIFGFMAATTAFNTVRSIKRSSPRSGLHRVRRLVGSKEMARSMAESLVREIARNHPDEVKMSQELEILAPELEEPLNQAEAYYLSRVESRHRVLFSRIVEDIILGRETSDSPDRKI